MNAATTQHLPAVVPVEGGTLRFGPDAKHQIIRWRSGGQYPATWSWRTAEIRLADGSVHSGMVSLCETDSCEHYATGIYLPEQGHVTFQDDADFLARLGRTREQVFPYRYRYFREVGDAPDHHVGADGWSRES